MTKEIRISIRKKTLVPTKRAIVHQWRSDWCRVGVIDYPQSRAVFKVIDGNGLIENDAQFAKLLFDNYGDGEYYCQAWCKGHEGFWNFMHVVCGKNGFFKRVEKRMTQEEKELRENVSEIRRLASQYKEVESEAEKADIVKEIDMLKDMVDLDKEIKSGETSKRRGPYPWLKTTQPIYKEHEYEEYRQTYKGEDVYQSFF